jgi:hypothetical protein
MRYTIARWGYSPNIFAWQLWSELNLTGTNPDRSWYRKPECVQWHRLMAQSVKNMDPYKHLVATHFSGDYTEQNKEIDALPEIDHCPLDAYHGSPTAIEIVKLMRETAAFMVPLDKPGLITEFGGNWGAQQGYAHIDHSLHAGLWASTAIPSGGTPMFWWWMIVEEEKLYPRYAALARFMNNVDLRDPTFQLFTTAYTPANITSIVATARSADVVRHDTGTTNAEWRIECFGNATYAQGWMYNLPGFETLTSATSPADDTLAIRFSGLTNPVYDVEFWDTARGMPIQTTRAATRDSILVTPVPPVVRDIAFKLRKANPQSESR